MGSQADEVDFFKCSQLGTSPKGNGWIPKMMGLGKCDSGFKYGHFWYLC